MTNRLIGMIWNQSGWAKWETSRWMAAVVIAPHTKKRMKPRDLIAFPWENKKRVHRAATFDEVKQAINKVFGNGETTN
jgi:hypothetical protein